MGIPIGDFDGSSLLDEGPLLEIFGVDLCALLGIFGGDVPTDGTTLVEDETIILEKDVRTGHTSMTCTNLKDGDLAERLHLHESFTFVLTLGPVDGDKLEGDFLLNENSRYTLSAGREVDAVEF